MFSHQRAEVQFVILTVQNTHRRALLFIDNRQFIGFLITQIKLSSIYRHKPIVTYWAWEKRQPLLKIQAKHKLENIQNSFFLLFGGEDSTEILPSVWQEEENFEVLKRCYIQIYYMEESVLLGTKPLVDSIRHFIRDPSGVFSVCHLCECRIVQ